jgi:hypothetical protein
MEDMLLNEASKKLLYGHQIVLDQAYVIYPENACIRHVCGDFMVVLIDQERRLGLVSRKNLFKMAQAQDP